MKPTQRKVRRAKPATTRAAKAKPWRAEKPADHKLYGDLQSPVLEKWD